MLAQSITIGIIVAVALIIGALGLLIHSEETKIKRKFSLFKKRN